MLFNSEAEAREVQKTYDGPVAFLESPFEQQQRNRISDLEASLGAWKFGFAAILLVLLCTFVWMLSLAPAHPLVGKDWFKFSLIAYFWYKFWYNWTLDPTGPDKRGMVVDALLVAGIFWFFR
jgi:hypothetical protein